MNEQEKQFIEQTKQVLDESVNELDSTTLAKLSRARATALERPLKARRWLWGLAPAVGLALTVLLIFSWNNPLPRIDKNAVDDLGMLVSEDPLELYEEIEFYLWLSEETDENSDFSATDNLPVGRLTGLGDRAGRITGPGAVGVSRCI